MISYWKDESGATTTDWVVLTASVVIVAVSVTLVIATGVFSSSSDVNSNIAETEAADAIVADDQIIQAEYIPIQRTEQRDFENWDQANIAIQNCIGRGGSPEIAASATTNDDGSPSGVTCG